MRLNDFGLAVLLVLLVFGHGYQSQKKYDLCEEIKFESKQCKVQKKLNDLKECCSK